MTVTSFAFLVFFLLVFLAYFWLNKRGQNALLVVASYIFIATWSPQFAIVFALLTLMNFLIGRQLQIDHATRLPWLRLGLVSNILILLYFKYANFFVPELLSRLENIPFNTTGLKILLPIGLSFVVVQMISYLIDVNRGLIEPAENLLDFSLYVVYFPKLTSGPLERYREFLPRIGEKRRIADINIPTNFTLILQGLFRKIVIADVLLLMLPANIFEEPKRYSAPELAIWLLAYAFALYNDFAGYTKLVRGLSGLLGIELTANFNVPYFSRNFTEFWQRWHISLSNWLRDYVFMPLSRGLLRRGFKRDHLASLIAPPMVTMLVSALWHDISLHMLFWGALHGFYQVVDRLRSFYLVGPPAHRLPFWRQSLVIVTVFVLAVLAWIPFRMELPIAWQYLSGLLTLGEWHTWGGIDWQFHFYWIVGILVLITFMMDRVEYHGGELAYLRLNPYVQALLINVVLLMMFVVLTARQNSPPPFIYQGF